MNIKLAFGKALKKFRKYKGFTQEDFSIISSRTYISSLERGVQSPTLEKIVEVSELLEIHPMTLMYLTFHEKQGSSFEDIMFIVKKELFNSKSLDSFTLRDD